MTINSAIASLTPARMRFAGVICALMVSGPALAQSSIEVPEGCTPEVTVHKAGCAASTIMMCGDERRAQTYTRGSLEHEHIYDTDWSLLGYNFETSDTVNMRHQENTGASMSFAELVETGASPSEGAFMVKTGRITREFFLSGENRLTGDSITLDGETFLVGESYRIFEPKPGAGGLEFNIDFLISPERNLFIEGSITRNAYGAGEEQMDHTPLALALPGAPGFLADRSMVSCDG